MPFSRNRRELVAWALKGTPVTVFFEDNSRRILWVENPPGGWSESMLVGRTANDLFDAASLPAYEDARRAAEQTGEDRSAEVQIQRTADSEGIRTFNVVVKPLFDEDASFVGCLCSSIEVTEDKQHEVLLKTLLREVSHRSKNMLAMVLGLASQTARSAPDTQTFIRRFTGRIQSLAKSQDAVTESNWRGARISELVSHQVVGVLPVVDGQIRVTGDDVELTPNGAMHVGLALHELCANAIAFGALSVPTGRIEINSTITNVGGERRAVLTWSERPRVETRTHREQRFGKTALERIVPTAVNGRGRLDFHDDGVTYTLEIGSSELVG